MRPDTAACGDSSAKNFPALIGQPPERRLMAHCCLERGLVAAGRNLRRNNEDLLPC
jgi:hypothetical protein